MTYHERVLAYEAQGLTTSDAQSVVDVEMLKAANHWKGDTMPTANQTAPHMTPEVHALIEAVDNILGDFSRDRYGYGAAAKMMDWPTRAALALALHNLKQAEGRHHAHSEPDRTAYTRTVDIIRRAHI